MSNKSGCSSTTTSPSHGVGASSRHARLLRQFNEHIFKRHVLTDVEVVVEGKTFKSHKAVLVCFSPALKRKLLNADGNVIAKKVYIPRINSKEFEILLHYMYTGDLNITCNNFYEIYRAVSVLEMQDVMQECLQILDRPDDTRTYFYIYVTAKKMDVQKNWMRALKLLTHRFEEAICDPQFLQIDLNCVLELLSAQTIGARSEVLVYLAGLNWLNHDCNSRLEHAVKVMECVRFSSMTMDEIVACYHPPFLPELLDTPEIVLMLLKATCYITAKFRGQESGFKQFGSRKRNLTFEKLPMELWHKKELPKMSTSDLAATRTNSVRSVIPENSHNSLNSMNDVSSFSDGNWQSRKPMKQSHSLQHTKDEVNHHPPSEQNKSPGGSPTAESSNREESGSHLAVVKEVLEQSAQSSRDEINVAEVVKTVLGEINTRGDQKEENRYRLNCDKAEKEPKQEKLNKIAPSEKTKHLFHTSSKPSAPIEKTPDSKFHNSGEHSVDRKTMSSKMRPKDGNSSILNPEAKIRPSGDWKPVKNKNDEIVPKSAKRNFEVDKKRNEPVLLTAVKEERSLLGEATTRLKYEPSPLQVQLKHLEDTPPRQALFAEKSSWVNIVERENKSSSVNLSPKRENPALIVTGGMNPRNMHTVSVGEAVLNYDPKEDKWTKFVTLPSPRHNHSAVFWDNCLYIIGGCNPLDTLKQKCYVAKRSCYKLDLATLEWSPLEEMKFQRYDHSAAVLEGQIYVIGGQDNGNRLLKSMELFDIKKGHWEVHPFDMCCGRKAMGIAVFEGKLWVAGGLVQADKEATQQVVSHVDCYDPKQKRWTFNLCCLPTPRCYCSLAVWNGCVYCIGGLLIEPNEKMRATKEVWVLNKKGNAWEESTSLPVARMSCATLIYDGLLYVIGGFDPESDNAIRNVNYLFPAAICWEVGAPLPSHLFGIAAVSVPKVN